MTTKPKVAFIGLGAMGMGMALHLLDDGFVVSGYDVNPKALQILEEKGGIAASSPRNCATDASFLVCMVANAAQTEEVLFTVSTGAVFGLPSNATVILCSTVPPSFPGKVLVKFHVDLARPDVQLVDCPVSGGTVRAAQGKLTILCSGTSEALVAAGPVLDSMAETKYEIDGGLGSANKVKLVNQHLAGIHIAAAAEAMGLVASLGLSTKAFHDTVLGSTATSWMFENRVPHMLADDWTPHSALAIFVKDMGIVTTEGLVQGVPLWVASSAEQLYLLGAQMGYDREDDAGVVRVFLPKSPSLVYSAARAATSPDDPRTFELIRCLLEIVHTVAAIEALALGDSLGLSTRDLVRIISNAAGASEAFKRASSRIMAGDSTSGPNISETRCMLTDVALLAKKLRYPLHLAATALNLYDLALVRGLGSQGVDFHGRDSGKSPWIRT
ncbi:NAD binding domain of 6-phosphogluconate dehydrogenase-domain-containing protein [Aspergillus pseudoustus]|uniref:NAD binding domain of 6-phosphogluconate dehydrogenase-domain-containing protein n=1 Tax=Aspergillus pseudoustus TaxID=1810923 RepID=A0ABR4JH77_9EURO